MTFHFESSIAEDFSSSDIAVLVDHFDFWIAKNKSDGRHFHDGKYWTYGTVKSFSKIFVYLTKNQIRRLLEKMISLDILIEGNYNNINYDRTKWYTFSEPFGNKYKSILRFCQIDLADLPNGIGENAKPIPYTNTYVKPDNNNEVSKVSKKESIKAESKLKYGNLNPDTWKLWTEFKKEQFKFSYKSEKSEQIAINDLIRLSKNNDEIAKKIVFQSISNGWKGLFELKQNSYTQKSLSFEQKSNNPYPNLNRI
jgi:hypothetical protein